ncbi:MAG: hypothetical protein L7U87_05450 [Chlamydiales bacterium]|nr:hypothetical protein [Chlamydiales bacterium]
MSPSTGVLTMPEEHFKECVEVLLDPDANEVDKDAATLYLSEEGEVRGLNPLIFATKHPSENDIDMLSDYGEAIAILWVKINYFDMATYLSLPRKTRGGVRYVLNSRRPDIVEEFRLNDSEFL